MTVILVPGLRGPAPEHWQQHLARETGAVHLRTDRAPLDLRARVADLEAAVAGTSGPVVLVAHSAGVLTAVHWASGTQVGDAARGPATAQPAAPPASAARVATALLVTPPTLAQELPEGYPRLKELRAHGWLPLPRRPLPFPVRVGLSDDDPLGPVDGVAELARSWGVEGAALLRLGAVGHANPASGYGRWPAIEDLVHHLADTVPVAP